MTTYYKKLEQRSKEWFEVRAGVTSGTDMKTALSTGAGQKTLMYKKLASKYLDDSFLPEDLDFEDTRLEQKIRYAVELSGKDFANRGIELEPYIVNLYEKQTRRKVHEVGFVKLDEYTGCSPDGLIRSRNGYVGAIEIKSLLGQNHLKLLDGGFLKSEYKAQVINYFVCIETLEWIDCIAYHPGAKPPFRAMNIERIYREDIQDDIAKQCKKLGEYIENSKTLESEILAKFNTDENTMEINPNKLYPVSTVAEYFSVSVQAVRNWCSTGKIKSTNIGSNKRKCFRVLGEDILTFKK